MKTRLFAGIFILVLLAMWSIFTHLLPLRALGGGRSVATHLAEPRATQLNDLAVVERIDLPSSEKADAALFDDTIDAVRPYIPDAPADTRGTTDETITPTLTSSNTLTLTSGVSAHPTAMLEHGSARLTEADWYMAAANPQRTSWVSEEVRGELNVEWYRPIEPYIPYKVQPIAANGKIYISTSRGLYAFNADNGHLDWVYPTQLPLGHSPTIAYVDNQLTAYVGGYDRKIHAIDANSGQAISRYTPFEANAGFETNPLVVGNTIFAGNRDGYFYALDAATGSLKWKYETDGPILFSAAYKDGVIYFASNDAHAYAVNAGDGSLVWRSAKLSGAGFHSFWPVVYTEKLTGKDYVIFSGSENYKQLVMSLTYQEGEELFPECYPDCPWGNLIGPSQTANQDPYYPDGSTLIDASDITNYYEAKPFRRTVFILDRSNGQEYAFDSDGDGKLEYAPFNWSGVTQSGNKYPPVINHLDGIYYQHATYISAPWIVRGDVVGWKFGTHSINRIEGGDVGHALDEPMAYSSGGKLIYWALCCDREAGGIDATIPYGSPNRAWAYYGYNLANNVLAPGYQQMYDDGNASAYNNLDGWQIYSGKSQSKNGIYGKHGSTQSPPIPYQGKIYLLKGNALIAFSATGTNPQTPLPLATIVPAQDAPTPLSRTELGQRLENEVQKILDAGPLRPGYHAAGFIDLFGNGHYTDEREFGEIFDYFQNPADTVYTLLLAYPLLPSTTQQQVKTYLQNNYGPGATYDFTEIVHVGWGTGAAREVFDIPPEVSDQWGEPYRSPYDPSTQPICGGCGYWQNFPPFSFYAAWQYAQIVGDNDPAFAKSIFDQMSTKLEPPLSDDAFISKPYWLNLYIAGYKGYLELQQLAGYPPDHSILATYQRLLDLRVNRFSKDTPYPAFGASSSGQEAYNNTLAVARNFMFLTPELADYLNEHAYPKVQEAVDEYEYVAPYWFVSKFDDSYGEGTLQHLYDYPALLQAKAYILKEPYTELVKYLDVPAFHRGDLFYIQNLVAILAEGYTPGFTLKVNPKTQSVDAGSTANYVISIQHSPDFTQTVTLEVGPSPSPTDLVVDLASPTSFNPPGGETTLTLTDLHTLSLLGVLWYTVPVTATGGDMVQTTDVYLLVNAQMIRLPVILK